MSSKDNQPNSLSRERTVFEIWENESEVVDGIQETIEELRQKRQLKANKESLNQND